MQITYNCTFCGTYTTTDGKDNLKSIKVEDDNEILIICPRCQVRAIKQALSPMHKLDDNGVSLAKRPRGNPNWQKKGK